MPSNPHRQFHNTGNFTVAVLSAIREWAKLNLFTMMPGIIEEYDAKKSEALVRPAISIIMDDDASEVERSLVSRVPVWFIGGGKWHSYHHLEKGDPVLLLHGMRYMGNFLKGKGNKMDKYRVHSPEFDNMFHQNDCIALAGLTPPDPLDPTIPVESPLSGSGWYISNLNRTCYMEMGDDEIKFSLVERTPEHYKEEATEEVELILSRRQVEMKIDSTSVRINEQGVQVESSLPITLTGNVNVVGTLSENGTRVEKVGHAH